jgi:hypothetical protein
MAAVSGRELLILGLHRSLKQLDKRSKLSEKNKLYNTNNTNKGQTLWAYGIANMLNIYKMATLSSKLLSLFNHKEINYDERLNLLNFLRFF